MQENTRGKGEMKKKLIEGERGDKKTEARSQKRTFRKKN